jgi:hypothetical protein
MKLTTPTFGKTGKAEDWGANGKDRFAKLSGLIVEWIMVGLHRSSVGPGLKGQPAPILTASFKGVAPINKGIRRSTTVKMMILDFMIIILILFLPIIQ